MIPTNGDSSWSRDMTCNILIINTYPLARILTVNYLYMYMSPCRVDKGQTDLYNGITYAWELLTAVNNLSVQLEFHSSRCQP